MGRGEGRWEQLKTTIVYAEPQTTAGASDLIINATVFTQGCVHVRV